MLFLFIPLSPSRNLNCCKLLCYPAHTLSFCKLFMSSLWAKFILIQLNLVASTLKFNPFYSISKINYYIFYISILLF